MRDRRAIVILNFASVGWALLKDSVFALTAKALFNRQVVLWMHGNGIIDFAQRSRLSKQVVATALRSATCLVVPREALKPSFEQWVPQQRIRAVHHGIVPSLAPDLAEKRDLPEKNALRSCSCLILIERRAGL